MEFEGAWYSVPYIYVGKEVIVKSKKNYLEIFLENNRIASHMRLGKKGRHSTVTEHMPSQHKAIVEWNPQRIKEWAKSQGEYVVSCVEIIMQRSKHPEQGFRSCLGILRLGKKFENGLLNKACYMAYLRKNFNYHIIKNLINQKSIEKIEIPNNTNQESKTVFKTHHENIRGKDYYH